MSFPASRVDRPLLLSPGALLLLVLAAVGYFFLGLRFLYGIGFVSNISQDNPWGLWNWSKVIEFALSAGSFCTVGLVYVFHRTRYAAVIRPVLLYSMLGYAFVGFTIFYDIGRYYNFWHLFYPPCFNGDSVLFEVGWCLLLYLSALALEFAPIVVERFSGRVALPGPFAALNSTAESLLTLSDKILSRLLAVIFILGIVFSFLHQSSLGGLMLITGAKLHPLWFTPWLPLLFLLSALATGFPMAILITQTAGRAFRRPFDSAITFGLGRYAHAFLGLFLVVYYMNLFLRNGFSHLALPSLEGNMFLLELSLYTLPFLLYFLRPFRTTVPGLGVLSIMTILGMMVHRANVFLIAYTAPFSDGRYVPALTEVLVLVGVFSSMIFLFRAACIIFPILPAPGKDVCP
ncbi:MAG: NrfD/PsrC family molybdoenzyme membrane anchor subunit [Fibrobacterota bacterium]